MKHWHEVPPDNREELKQKILECIVTPDIPLKDTPLEVEHKCYWPCLRAGDGCITADENELADADAEVLCGSKRRFGNATHYGHSSSVQLGIGVICFL